MHYQARSEKFIIILVLFLLPAIALLFLSNPITGIALYIGCIGAAFILFRPILGLLMMVFFIPIEVLTTFGGVASMSKIIGLWAFLAWVIHILFMSREPIKTNNIFWLLLVFCIWAWASILWSVNPGASIARFINLAQLIGLFLLIINLIDSKRKLNWLLAFYIFGCLISGLFAMKGFFASGTTSGIHGRMSIVGQNPNALGGLMGIAILFSWYLFSEVQNSLSRAIILVFLMTFLYVLIMAQSRTAWVAFTLGSGIYFLSITEMNTKSLIKFSLFAIGMVVIIFFIVYLSPARTLLEERFSGLLQMKTAGRSDIWKTGFELWKDNPVFGVGLNNFREVFNQYLGISSFGPTRYIGSRLDPHNAYLCILSELGLVGFAIFSAMLYCCLRTLRKYDRTLKAFMASTFVFILVLSLGGTLIWSKNYWLILGLIGAGLNFNKGLGQVPTKDGTVQLLDTV